MNVKQYDLRKNPCVPELLSPGNTSQLIEQNEGFCLGSHHEIRSVYKYMHKETHTNTLKEHFIWTGSTYQRGDLWGTVEHGQAEITGRMLFRKANEIFLVYIFFATAAGIIMKTMKLLLVKPLLQKFLNRCFSPKHLGGCYNSPLYYHFHARRNFLVIQLEYLSLTTFSNHFNSLCGGLLWYPMTLDTISL